MMEGRRRLGLLLLLGRRVVVQVVVQVEEEEEGKRSVSCRFTTRMGLIMLFTGLLRLKSLGGWLVTSMF